MYCDRNGGVEWCAYDSGGGGLLWCGVVWRRITGVVWCSLVVIYLDGIVLL